MTDKDRAELGKILDAVSVNSPVEDFVATDLEFHRRIAQGSSNSVLASLVDNRRSSNDHRRRASPAAAHLGRSRETDQHAC
jgi:GntR family transcriptional regulator, transcriptional repressor for pyruvate dehydrogenase complex